jgi:hypothetical protein
MPYNTNETNAEELFEFLEALAKLMDQKVRMYALGGTALTILGLKKSTRDIDMNIVSKKEYDYLSKIFEQAGFEKIGAYRWLTQAGLAFDLFCCSNIVGTQLLPDCTENAKHIRSFGTIEIYTHSLQDIIISKLARGDERDFADIKVIYQFEKIDNKLLARRYKETMEVSVVAMYKQKLLDLIEIKFGDWQFPLDKELIREVESWEQT